MSLIIADPEEQRRFACFLRELSDFLARKRGQFLTALSDAELICRDDKYVSFRREVNEAMEALSAFEAATERYAEQLDHKARLGQRFLDN